MHGNQQEGVFGAWYRDPGHWEAALTKERSDCSADLLGFHLRGHVNDY